MFRKISHIALALLLLTTTMGFTVSKHYCGNELIEVAIDSKAKSCCDPGCGCCHDEMEYFQLKEDVVGPVYFENIIIANFDILFPLVFNYLLEATIDIEAEVLNFAESPHPPNINTRLSLIQTFLC